MKKAYREMYTLRTARDRLGLTQKEAAKKLGISDDVLSNYERGKTYPNIPMLKKIEEVYQVEYDQLLFLEKDNAKSVLLKEINMNEVQLFNFENHEVRSLLLNNEPWFVGKDVADVLGYQNGSRDINRHVDEEDRQNYQNGTFDSPRGMTIINESGLYSLVLSSKLPSAKKFKRWVTSEVLPALRKTGQYQVKELSGSELMAKALIEAQNVLAAKDKVIEEMKPKVVFADAVATSHTSILVGELAKILKQNGIDMGQKRLFAWLREKGYLIKRQGTDYNMPTQKAMELGLFEIKEGSYVNGSGVNITTKTPKITGKGQQYFINKFLQ